MKAKKMLVWVPSYDPFIMGGEVHRIKTTEFPVIREFSMRGFKCACVQDAKGKFRIASVSAKGALVSDAHGSADAACEAVVADIKAGDLPMMRQQVRDACNMFANRGHHATKPADFFN